MRHAEDSTARYRSASVQCASVGRLPVCSLVPTQPCAYAYVTRAVWYWRTTSTRSLVVRLQPSQRQDHSCSAQSVPGPWVLPLIGGAF
eukprot:864022-Rhodomonas_salina.2